MANGGKSNFMLYVWLLLILTTIRFGTVATLLELVPFASILFSFTNTGNFYIPKAMINSDMLQWALHFGLRILKAAILL